MLHWSYTSHHMVGHKPVEQPSLSQHGSKPVIHTQRTYTVSTYKLPSMTVFTTLGSCAIMIPFFFGRSACVHNGYLTPVSVCTALLVHVCFSLPTLRGWLYLDRSDAHPRQELSQRIHHLICVPSCPKRIQYIDSPPLTGNVPLQKKNSTISPRTITLANKKILFFKTRSNFLYILQRNDILITMLPSDFP